MMSRITTRFVMAIATAAVAPLLIFGLVSIYSLRAGNRQSVTEGNLNVAHQAAERINLYVQSNVKVLRALAIELRTADLRLWQQDRILKDYVLDFPEFRELSLFAPDERVLATSRVGPPRLSVPADYRGDSPRIAPITVDDDFLPTTTVTIPLTRHANRDGWLMGELNLEELWRMVDSIRVGADGFALLVASNGRLIAHGNPDEKARVASGEDLSGHGLVSAVKSQRESTGHRRLDRRPDRAANSTLGLEYRDDRGRQLLGVAAPIPALDWTVIVEQPTTEAYALADQLELQLFVIITLALLATVTLGYYWGRSFIRPIFALMKGTQAIAAGNLDNRVAIPGNDEFHQLKRFSNRPCTTWGGRGTSAHTDAGGPMRAYSMDLRERALLDSDAGMKAADVAAKYRVSGSWVRLLKQRRRETGEVAPRVQRHGRRCMLEPHLHTLAALIAAHPDRTLAELKDALATPASVPTVWRAVRALGLTVKKTVRPSEHDRPDVAAARVAWHAAAPTWDVAHLVCLDETGITTNLLRRYGRAPRGARVHDHAPCGRWQTSTFLAALRVTGLTAPGVFDGAIDGESFRAYIDQILVPTLQPGDIVIADNLGAHKVAGIQRALQAAGATLWYLPPYSPDLNPIELCFAKLKALVRTARCRRTETLWPFLGECLAHFSPDECRNYVRHCGYSAATRS